MVGLFGDNCNSEDGVFENPTGNFHIDRVPKEPLNNAWTHCDEEIPNYCPPGNNTLDIPIIDKRNFDGTYPIYCHFQFTGILPAGDSHKVLYRVDDGPWIQWAEITSSEAFTEGVNDGWYHWVSTRGPAINMNLYGTYVQFRICVGEIGGPAKGFYFDDLLIWGVQNYTDIGGCPSVDYVIENGDTLNQTDTNGNDIVDQEVDPGRNVTFKLKIWNTGECFIEDLWFEIEGLPDRWTGSNVEFIHPKVDNFIFPNETDHIFIKIIAPKNERASSEFISNPYIINISTHARGSCSSNVIEYYELETIVKEKPAIDVSPDFNNISGARGERFQNNVSIINTGNCVLSYTIETKVRLSVNSHPDGWEVNLNRHGVNLEFEAETKVKITGTIPYDAVAGYYRINIKVSIVKFNISHIIAFTVGVAREYGLELIGDENESDIIEVDPTQPTDREQSVSFYVLNTGNGEDIAKIIIEPENPLDDDWFDMVTEFVELGPTGHPDDKKELVIDFDIPLDAAAGDHDFSVRAVSEKDATGETVTEMKSITIRVLRPDLEFSGVIGFDPVAPVLGETTLISCNLFNNGTAPAANFSVNLFIDEILVGLQRVNLLDADSVLELTPFEYVFSEKKRYSVEIVIDFDANISELNENNNVLEKEVRITAPELEFLQPEITFNVKGEMKNVPLGKYWKFEVVRGTEFSFSIPVENSGDADAKNVRIILVITYFNADGIEAEEIVLEDSFDVIIAGDIVNATFIWKPGKYDTEYEMHFKVESESMLEGEIPSLESYPTLVEQEPETASGERSGFIVAGGVLMILVLMGIGVILFLKKRKS